MKIMDILVKDAVILNLGVREQARRARRNGQRPGQGASRRSTRTASSTCLLEREALQSTGIGEGVAIPHGKMVGLDRLVATFARSTQGVDFESIDGQPTQHFFLLVVPEHSGGQYLKAWPASRGSSATRPSASVSARPRTLEEIFAIEEEDAKF